MMMMNHPARTLTVLALATVTLFSALLLIAPFPILDTQPGVSAGEVYHILGELTDAQRARYRVMLAVDFLFPLAYAGFLVVALRNLGSRTSGLLWLCRLGVAAAITAAVSDYIENTLIIIILQSFPDPVAAAGAVGGITMLKWSTLGIASGTILVAGIVLLAKRRTRS